MQRAAPWWIAVIAGAALWFAAAAAAGQREAWDAPAYWSVVYPAALLVSAALGYGWPERPWRWPLALFAAQFVAMCVRNGELGNLWPLGLALFAVLALPGVLAARFGARLARRSRG
jgi:peptidoglycan/LPS O-acetylase OafA/YrhL